MINYIYGPNGSGKTTISRGLSGQHKTILGSVTWTFGVPSRVLVYNRDYVDRTFVNDSTLEGIFTLGEDSAVTRASIERLNSELGVAQRNALGLAKSLGHIGDDSTARSGKRGEQRDALDELSSACWKAKAAFPTELQQIFLGYHGSRNKLVERVLEVRGIAGTTQEEIEVLLARADTAFNDDTFEVHALKLLDGTNLLNAEKSALLAAKIVGHEDVDIAALIRSLGNSDWVGKGREYFEVASPVCPFCQQQVGTGLAQSLASFFDESYVTRTAELKRLVDDYAAAVEVLIGSTNSLRDSTNPCLDLTALKAVLPALELTAKANLDVLKGKVETPSTPVSLAPLDAFLDDVNSVLARSNIAVEERNSNIRNRTQVRRTLIVQGWSHFVHSTLAVPLAAYTATTVPLLNAEVALCRRLKLATDSAGAIKRQLRVLEAEVTSSKPTIDAINQLLDRTGFTSFRLSEAKDVAGGYSLTRMDGSSASETLSEGERTFVSFLYYYQQLEQLPSEPDAPRDCVAVVDDPISSLDSESLFVVSGLIRNLVERINDRVCPACQLIVLTHNVYFHKEVTYVKAKARLSPRDVTHHVVRKSASGSTIVRFDTNPIKTSYMLLWDEIARARESGITPVGLQNTMRRILESYFRITGGWSDDDIAETFNGLDRIICGSLFSWVNDGSHMVLDDISVSSDGINVSMYLNVFKEVFVKTGHEAHYAMMMPAETAAVIAANVGPELTPQPVPAAAAEVVAA